MTGVVAGCLAAAGVIVLVAGTFAALALNSVPLAIAVTGASFGAMGLLGAWTSLRGRFRFPRPRPLTGWRLTAAAALSAACGAGCLAAGFLGLLPLAMALAVAAASLAVRCAVAGLAESRCPHQDRWTTGELAALDDEASLEQLLGATEAPREGRFR